MRFSKMSAFAPSYTIGCGLWAAPNNGTCIAHVPWCMLGSLTGDSLWSRWRGKRSRHSRRMRNWQFYVFGKRPIPSLSKPMILRDSHVVDGLHSTKYTTTTTKLYFLVYIPIWFHIHQRFDATNVISTNDSSHSIKEWQGYSIAIIYHDVPLGNQPLREPVLDRFYVTTMSQWVYGQSVPRRA